MFPQRLAMPKNSLMDILFGEGSCADNYLAAVHNDLLINLRLSISPLEPFICDYSRFIHIDIEES
jgi:hypothetical protein